MHVLGAPVSNIWQHPDGQLKIANSQEGHIGFESLLSVVLLLCRTVPELFAVLRLSEPQLLLASLCAS